MRADDGPDGSFRSRPVAQPKGELIDDGSAPVDERTHEVIDHVCNFAVAGEADPGRALDGFRERRRVGNTDVGISLESVADEWQEGERHVPRSAWLERGKLPVEDVLDDVDIARIREETRALKCLPEEYAGSEDVGRRSNRNRVETGAQLLGRLVRKALVLATDRARSARDERQTGVDEPCFAFGGDEDIGRRHVAVDDRPRARRVRTARVKRRQSREHVEHDAQRHVERELVTFGGGGLP